MAFRSIHTNEQRRLYANYLTSLMRNVQRLINTAEQTFRAAEVDTGYDGYSTDENDMATVVASIDAMYAQINASLTRMIDGEPFDLPTGIDAFGYPSIEYTPYLDIYAKDVDTDLTTTALEDEVSYGVLDNVWECTVVQVATPGPGTLTIKSTEGSATVFSKFDAGDKVLVSYVYVMDSNVGADFYETLIDTELVVSAGTNPGQSIQFDLPFADFPFVDTQTIIRYEWPKLVRVWDAIIA